MYSNKNARLSSVFLLILSIICGIINYKKIEKENYMKNSTVFVSNDKLVGGDIFAQIGDFIEVELKTGLMTCGVIEEIREINYLEPFKARRNSAMRVHITLKVASREPGQPPRKTVLDLCEIERFFLVAQSVSRVITRDNTLKLVVGYEGRLALKVGLSFFGVGDRVDFLSSSQGRFRGRIYSFGKSDFKLENSKRIRYDDIIEFYNYEMIQRTQTANTNYPTKTIAEFQPSELREIADLKEQNEHLIALNKGLRERAFIAEFKYHNIQRQLKSQEEKTRELGLENRDLRIQNRKLYTRLEDNQNLIDSMPKFLVNHYKNKLAKENY